MFEPEFTNTKAMIEKFTPDMKEDASKVKRPVTFLKISTQQQADSLAFLGAELRDHYFNKDAPVDLALGVPLRDTNEVFPHKRGEEMVGGMATIDYGVGAPMVFTEVNITDVSIHPMNGGMVIWGFTLEIRPNEVQAGRLYMLQKQEITLTIEPPELPVMKEAA